MKATESESKRYPIEISYVSPAGHEAEGVTTAHSLSEQAAFELLESLALLIAKRCQMPKGWQYVEPNEVIGPDPDWDGARIDNDGYLEASRTVPPEVETALTLRAKLNFLIRSCDEVALRTAQPRGAEHTSV